jgi:tyrosinase
LAAGGLDERQFFPDDVLETFRTWVNQGCRRSATDPIVQHNRIPPPRQRPVRLAIRKNILELTDAELLSYRLAVEHLGATTYPTSPEVPWQRIAYLHTDWCLHYQEAFLLWHRACLLYSNRSPACPPYWNWMSPRIADDGDPAAGLPRAFTDATFIDDLGRERPNPLRFAIAKDGVSKPGRHSTSRSTVSAARSTRTAPTSSSTNPTRHRSTPRSTIRTTSAESLGSAWASTTPTAVASATRSLA